MIGVARYGRHRSLDSSRPVLSVATARWPGAGCGLVAIDQALVERQPPGSASERDRDVWSGGLVGRVGVGGYSVLGQCGRDVVVSGGGQVMDGAG